MNDSVKSIEALFEKAKEFSTVTIDLVKLQAVDKSSDIISSLVARLAVFMVFTLFISFGSIGLSLWLGEIMGKAYYGFFTVTAFYAFAALLLYLFRKEWLKQPSFNSMISQMLGNRKYDTTGIHGLRIDIAELEKQKEYKIKLLKEQFHIVQATLSPMNVIRNTVHEAASSADIKNTVINNAIGLTGGLISKKLLFGSSHNPVKKVLGLLVEFAVANIISKHPDKIREVAQKLIHRIGRKKSDGRPEYPHY